ncbi:MAG: YihY/virulence factor BrkB family protein [Chloroflexota bacterium]
MTLQTRLEAFYERANQATGNRLDILRTAIQRFGEKQGGQAAASLSYYALFSLFPFLLTLIYFGSYFLESEKTYQQVMTWLYRALPVSRDVISENLARVVDQRGPIGVVGLITLLWAASGVFTGVAYHVNRAWDETDQRGFLQKRLIAFSMIAALTLLFLLSVALQTVLALLPAFDIPLLGNVNVYETGLWVLLSNLLPWFLIVLLYFALYLWVPARPVNWKAALWSGLVTATAWKVATAGFNWYLRSGFGQYELVYGSLGALVALLFLVYLIGWITLFGAHLCASLEAWFERRERKFDG